MNHDRTRRERAGPKLGAGCERQKVRFAVGGTECAAWHYPGTNGACVIMAGELAVTKEPGTGLFAKRFNDAEFWRGGSAARIACCPDARPAIRAMRAAPACR
jgi:hypothetical protein